MCRICCSTEGFAIPTLRRGRGSCCRCGWHSDTSACTPMRLDSVERCNQYGCPEDAVWGALQELGELGMR